MSVMRQVSLLAAGCQPWNSDVCAASCNGDRFAYCATLAVYVYEVSRQGKLWNALALRYIALFRSDLNISIWFQSIPYLCSCTYDLKGFFGIRSALISTPLQLIILILFSRGSYCL